MGAATMAVLDYEELRRRKLEENKRKIEELKLSHLSATLRQATSPKPSPTKPSAKRRASRAEDGEHIFIRRSSRIGSLPELPNYKDQMEISYQFIERRPRGRRPGSGFSTRKDIANRVYASDEARAYATEKAQQLEEKLQETDSCPTFVKPMTQSHVTGGFWLGLPRYFCVRHLPKKDSDVFLVDENGDESRTLYLANKNGLSAGWRGFAIDHKLVDGDALVFQLLKWNTFKVYIIRVNKYTEEE